jgi:two-component system, LuxR family, response regulator FixJ
MSRKGQTVFVIDDDESVRRAVGRLIRSAGLNVETFATAEDFMRSACPAALDCLVLDVHLPGLSGLELQQRLIAEGRRAPVVFITAYEDHQTCERALRAGAIAFLRKPFEQQSLLDAVDRAMRS